MNETKTEWRDCADPDELAAAVAAGVEVEVQRRVGQPWQPTRSIDAAQFAGFISTGHRYRLPTSWTWHQEPPAPDEVAAPDDDWCEAVLNDLNSIIHGHCGSDGSDDAHCDWVNDLANEVVRYFQRQDVLAVLPTPPAPPWPGAVLSGLTDEDGVPTWLALAPNVQGEAVRTCIDFPWFICGSDNEVTPYWVEVRAPRAVPEPETERVPWYRAPGRRQPGGDLLGPIVQAYPNPNLPGGMYVEYELPEHGTTTGNPNRHPDGMVEVLKDGGQ